MLGEPVSEARNLSAGGAVLAIDPRTWRWRVARAEGYGETRSVPAEWPLRMQLGLPRRGLDAVGILIVLRLGVLSIVAGWRPGGGRHSRLSYRPVVHDKGDEFAPRRA